MNPIPNETLETGAVRQKTAGRGMYELMSPFVQERDARLYEWGSAHRGLRNWEKGIPFSRCVQSIHRHLMQFMKRDNDPDHGDCLAAIRFWCAAIMHYEELIRRGVLPGSLDDMPKYDIPVPAPAWQIQGCEPVATFEKLVRSLIPEILADETCCVARKTSNKSVEQERIYVSGPISTDDPDAYLRNHQLGQLIGRTLEDKGHIVFTPHNYVVRGPDGVRVSPSKYEALLALDLSIVKLWATALFRIDASPGADRELEIATDRKLKIYHTLESVPVVNRK